MVVKPGYKQTEVGVIPVQWDCPRIRDAASRASHSIVGGPFGSDLVSADYVEVGTPVIRGLNMGSAFVSGDFVFVSDKKARVLSANLARAEDIIFTQRGTLGQVSIVPHGGFKHFLISQSQMKVSLDRARHDPRFVHHYFLSPQGQKQIVSSSIQTGVPHTNLGILRTYRFPAPPLHEQHAIATALSDADGLLGGLDRLIAKKRDLKQAAMQQLLTPPGAGHAGQKRLPGFTGEWEVKRLGDVADVSKGNGLSKGQITPAGARPCILYGELFTTYGRVILDVVSRTNSSEGRLSESGDVLMPGSTTTVGIDLATASALMKPDVALGGDVIVIRGKDKDYDPIFFATYLTHVKRHEIAERAQGITIYHLYGRDVATLPVSLPKLDEQTAIAGVLTDMDAELAALEQRREKTRHLKQAMMQELLTGRTRLV